MNSIQDQKLKDILLAAKELFWRYGFKRVSIEEISKEANVSKMTFYKHFKNKIELVKSLYKLVSDEAMKNYNSIMKSDISFVEKVKKSIDLKKDQTKMMSKEFYEDLMKSDDPEIIEIVNRSKKANIQLILNDYIQAQQKGDIRKNLKPEFILYFLNHMFEMAGDDRLNSLYDTPNEMIMELTNFFFYGILPRQNE